MLTVVTDQQNGIDLSFDGSFWLLYPRKVAKKDARRAWARMTDADRVKAIVALYDWRRVWEFEAAKEGEDHINYLPHPATWLNGERWEDELPAGHKRPSVRPVSQAPTEPQRVDPMPDHVKALLAKLRSR